MEIIKVSDNIYQMTTPKVNIFFVKNDKNKILIVDSGVPGTGNEIVQGLQEIGNDINDVAVLVGTHTHYDHIGSVRELLDLNPNIKVYMNKTDAQLVDDNFKNIPELKVTPGGEEFLAKQRAEGGVREPLKQFSIDKYLDESSKIEGFENIDIVEMFGHTFGQVALLIHDNGKNVFLAADAIRRGKVLEPMAIYSDLKMGLETIAKLKTLNIDIVAVGHGQPALNNVEIEIANVIEKANTLLKEI